MRILHHETGKRTAFNKPIRSTRGIFGTRATKYTCRAFSAGSLQQTTFGSEADQATRPRGKVEDTGNRADYVGNLDMDPPNEREASEN